MKKIVTIFGTIFVVTLALLALGCTSSPAENEYQQGNTTPTATEKAANVELVSHELQTDEFGISSVKGEAKANADVDYAEVNVKFFDDQNRLIYSGLANVADLKAGEIWLFKAYGPTEPVDRYEISIEDVTY